MHFITKRIIAMQAKLCTLSLLAFILIFSACQKGVDVIDPPTKTELLTDGSWEYTAHTVEPGIIENGVTITDLYIQKDECAQDDVLSFTSTQTFTVDEGDARCGTEQILDSGTWVFTNSQDNISFTSDGGGVTEFEFETLDRDELILLKMYTDNSINFVETITYTSID